MEANIFHQTDNILGEGPLWHPTEKVLYWVDIEARKLFRLEIINGDCQQFTLPSRPGCLAAAEQGVFVALELGLAHVNPKTGKITQAAQPLEGRTDVRFNDGKCDRRGRFWAGTLDLAEQNPNGALYRFDDFHTATEQDKGFTVSNGLGWSIDNKIMYFTDSPTRTIYAYDYDIEHGAIANRRPFITLTDTDGYPDGLCVDSEGFIWVCHWDGWKITRFDPEGKVEQVIKTKVRRPTCPTFGGPGLSMLFFTSARRDLTAEDLAVSPDAGSLFVIETDYKGIAETVADIQM